MMNLLQVLMELFLFVIFFLIDNIKTNDLNPACQIEYNQQSNVSNCNNLEEKLCLNKDYGDKCLSIIKDLKNFSFIESKDKQTKLVIIDNNNCFYFQICPKCFNKNDQICNNLNKNNINFDFSFDTNKLKIYRKNGFTVVHVLIFPIIILSIAIVLVILWKKGYITICEKINLNERVISLKRRINLNERVISLKRRINLNEKVISLKRRISMKTNKDVYANSFQDMIGSYENLSNNSALNPTNVECINEFKRVCTNSKIQEEDCNLTTNDGKLLINSNKNRFINILPFDQSRVKLQRTIYESDYINASYIPFFKNPSVAEYIACQGPLPDTITDFWWMIWEQNVSVIVMLTKLFESGRVKCEQYWPSLLNEEEESEENSDFSVLLTEEIEYSSFTERKLKLTNKISSKWRNIIHLQMHSWNDFGVPNLEEFEKSLYRFREITSSDNSPPYVIHCSAGVGRSGTFITIDRIMKKVLSGKPFVNIYEEVLELRKYRSFMVQQKDQYIFIHKFIGYFLKRFHEKDNDCEIEENVYE